MILILKTGSAPANIRAVRGDFEDWIGNKMQLNESDYDVCVAGDYQTIPPERPYSGIVVTGSPMMVAELEWENRRLCNWLLEKQQGGIPILGICFGLQLLAVLNGGTVAANLSGTEIGSARTRLTRSGRQDLLLGDLPPVFEVYKSHKQSVSSLPEACEILATNSSGLIDAVRFSARSWGVQFHPEFDGSITRLYLQEKSEELVSEGVDVQKMLKRVVEVDYGMKILRRFKEIALSFPEKGISASECTTIRYFPDDK